jgi:hypothetical protein
MKQYICNKAKECEAYWCIHNRPHTDREDGEEDFYHRKLSCTQRRLSDRGCSEIGVYGEVKCVPVKGAKGYKKIPENNEYEDCAYYEENTRECCNGVEEGILCLGLFKQKCEAYEEYDFGFDFIELI